MNFQLWHGLLVASWNLQSAKLVRSDNRSEAGVIERHKYFFMAVTLHPETFSIICSLREFSAMKRIIFTLAAIAFSAIPATHEAKAQNSLPTCPKPAPGHYVIRVPSSGAYDFVRSQLGDAIRCRLISNGQLSEVVQAGNATDRATAERYLATIKVRFSNASLIPG